MKVGSAILNCNLFILLITIGNRMVARFLIVLLPKAVTSTAESL